MGPVPHAILWEVDMNWKTTIARAVGAALLLALLLAGCSSQQEKRDRFYQQGIDH